jgi:hypothetical protein
MIISVGIRPGRPRLKRKIELECRFLLLYYGHNQNLSILEKLNLYLPFNN